MKYLLFISSILVVSVSCTKRQLKKPVEVNFALTINKSFADEQAIKMTQGEIYLSEFNVSGTRLKGEAIDFTRDFETPFFVSLTNSGEEDELNFDIPQGEYEELTISFETPDDSDLPVMILEGIYKPLSGPVKSVILEVSGKSKFSMQAEDVNSAAAIELDKKEAKKITIELDPIHWFSEVPVSMLETADTFDGDIIISATKNTGIYEIITDHMDESNRAIVK